MVVVARGTERGDRARCARARPCALRYVPEGVAPPRAPGLFQHPPARAPRRADARARPHIAARSPMVVEAPPEAPPRARGDVWEGAFALLVAKT